MKQILLGIVSLLLTAQKAPTLTPTDQGSSVKFEIKNFGFTVGGSFTGLKGNVKFDPNELNNSLFDVTIDANTINTGIDMRDEHLRGEDYFNVKNYPRIHFVSTSITPGKKAGTFFVSGNLTIKETTKEISFPFTAQSQAEGFLFNGEFKINRRDFKVGGGGTISNDLNVKLEVVAKK
jgi:polyisoprenoid-binding protein YceI